MFGTRSVYAERVATGYFLDIVIQRDRIARYGFTVDDVNEIIQTAIGGMNLTTTVEGRARYPVNIRYPRDLRNDVEKLKRILVPVMAPVGVAGMASSGNMLQVPMGELADFNILRGPTSIKSEEGLLTAYVYIDIFGRDVGGYVEEAKQKAATITMPEGYRLAWSGEYEYILKNARAPQTDHSFYAADYFYPSLFQHALRNQDSDCLSRGALFPGGIFLVAVFAQLQYEHCRMGGDHRAGWVGRGDGRGHAPLP